MIRFEITLSEFENFVPSVILMRGKDYYNDNAVITLKETSTGEWEATVEGTEEYSVEISLEGNEIESWFCDCPYDGDICKHVVAVLYAIRNKNKKVNRFLSAEEAVFIEEISEKQHQEIPDLEKLLSFIDKKKLIAFICQQALTHPDLQESLLQNFAPKKSAGQITIYYNKKIDACFNSSYSNHSNRYNSFEQIDLDETFLVKTSSQSLDYMIKYAHHLIQSFPDEMLAIYNSKIQKYAEENVGSNYYGYIVQVLKKMLEFPKGKEMTNLLVADFRIRYKRRPAMMELLREF